jgi:hypothetical protein
VSDEKSKRAPNPFLQPEYAIGQKLLTRDEYDTLRKGSGTESEIAFGMVIPLVLLAVALWQRGYSIAAGWVAMTLAVVFLLAGFDRLHKFRSDLQALIRGRLDARRTTLRSSSTEPPPDGATPSRTPREPLSPAPTPVPNAVAVDSAAVSAVGAAVAPVTAAADILRRAREKREPTP